MSLNNLSPDFYRTVISNGPRNQRLIYSTLENLIVTDPDRSSFPEAIVVDPKEDLCIYADSITFYGKIKIPGGNIKIVARKIILGEDVELDIMPDPVPDPENITTAARPFTNPGVQTGMSIQLPDKKIQLAIPEKPEDPNSVKQMVMCTASYPPPQPIINGEDGKAGLKGNNAGQIEITAQVLESGNFTLNLIANGGQGQIGQGGMSGPIGSFGTDGDIFILGGESVLSGIRNGRLDNGKWPVLPGNGGAGGNGGMGGNGGTGGKIILQIPSASSVQTTVNGGTHGTDGAPGKGGPGGPGCKIDIWKRYTGAHPGNSTHWTDITIDPGPTGPDGKSPDRNATPGIGAAGSVSSPTFSDETIGAAFDSTWLLKMLQRAKNYYMYTPPQPGLSDADRRNTPAFLMLDWLVSSLYSLNLTENTAENLRKKEILTEAVILLNNYSKGKSIFGKDLNWVPRRSLAELQQEMQALIPIYKDIEKTFLTNLKNEATTNQNNLDLTASKNQLSQSQDIINKKIQSIKEIIPDKANQIDLVNNNLQNLKANLSSILADDLDAIKNYFQCSLENVLKALEMIAFDPENLFMAGVQGAGLLNKSLTEINGEKKSNIIDKITRLQGDLKASVREEYNNNPPSPDDYTEILIADLDDFTQNMGNFEQAFSDHGDALKSALADLKSLVKLRGERLIEYNVTLSTLLQYQQQNDTIQSQIDNVNRQISTNADPVQTGLVSYYGAMYQNMRDQVMELVFDSDQALQFWSGGSAKPEKGFDHFREQILWTDAEAPSQFSAADLEDALAGLMKAAGDQQEKFGIGKMSIPDNSSLMGNIAIKIDDAGTINHFRDNKAFNIRTVKENAVGALEFTVENTSGLYDIRVRYVRPRLRFNAGTTFNAGQTATFNITHLNEDRLYRKDGSYADFKHDPVTTLFTQSLVPSPDGKDWGSGGDGTFNENNNGNGEDSEFAPPGLFTSWKIVLDTSNVPDLTQLASIDIEFGCLAYVNETSLH